MNESERELITILAEEAAEVVQACTKCLRFGLNSDNLGKLLFTNRQELERELGDMQVLVNWLIKKKVISAIEISDHAERKIPKLLENLRH